MPTLEIDDEGRQFVEKGAREEEEEKVVKVEETVGVEGRMTSQVSQTESSINMEVTDRMNNSQTVTPSVTRDITPEQILPSQSDKILMAPSDKDTSGVECGGRYGDIIEYGRE